MLKNTQDNDFNDDKLITLNSITVNRNPFLNNELASKEYVEDTIGEITVLRFNQLLELYLKVSAANGLCNLTQVETKTIYRYNKS